MAEENESEYIEGFNSGGKDLQRINQQGQLLDLLKKTNQARNEVDNILAREMDSHQKLQNTLNLVNDDFLKKTTELDGMRKKQQVSLDQTRKNELSEVMRSTLDIYLERRPFDPNDKRSVHVYFLTGEEIGSELHVGREGAGSRDATFIVTLSQSVQSLATQAAKYWGLDPEKVFFLDRDGRIVQGKMSLSDIILPPLTPDMMEASSASAPADTQAIVPAGSSGSSSSALAIPKAADDGQIAFTVKGRDYSLTLVRAKTVLSKEDLSQPKGEQWNDFTFDQKRLNEDLEMTRKKRGDPDPQDMKINMDTIPSLYDLIKKGNLRKFQKNADKWCRIMELLIFLITWGVFIVLLEPNADWTLYMKYAGKGIERNMTQFTLAEQRISGAKDFNSINTSDQFETWVQGPLRRAVFPQGIESMNAYVLKVQGRVYKHKPISDNNYDLNWCVNGTSASDDNGTNTSNNTLVDADGEKCYPDSLKSCPTKGVVELMAHAIDNGQKVPECRPIYDNDRVMGAIQSLYSADAFSFISGQVSSYLGGEQHGFNLTSWANWNASVADFLPSYDAVDHLQPPARLINVLTFVPALRGIVLSQFLTEFTPSGPVDTTQRITLLDMDPGSAWQVACYQVCIVLSLLVLFLEIRRITGLSLPFIKFFEEKKEPFGLATILFLLVPVLLLLSFWIMLRKMGEQPSVLDLSSDMLSDDEPDNLFPVFMAKSVPYEWTVSEKLMRNLQLRLWLDKVGTVVDLLIFTLMMLLSFRYALVYFPEMKYTTRMIMRVTIPVLMTLLMVVFAFAGSAVLFFLIFSDEQYMFRNWLTCIMSLVLFAHGGIMNWEEMYHQYAWTWYFLVVASFFIFTLNLHNILIAVLVSHKKEAELQKNYSCHPFWQSLSRDNLQSGGGKDVNPALAGYDFGKKDEPKKVTEEPGWKI